MGGEGIGADGVFEEVEGGEGGAEVGDNDGGEGEGGEVEAVISKALD